ncbi:transcriptional regulator family: Fungal Specific TF [Trichoderma aggressivum f. europaeum]|uniref:Transcriptional regulator family: Fungal Specific TF n=1 Tax=Trichoderma aggressivum f. europaeum TaxID=173218 RepID=A0AAE1LYD2_9HYPO|nr:transcriptional regulator family: Fungal Specific TF [Trichoderma aggressivum f. europaeum]
MFGLWRATIMATDQRFQKSHGSHVKLALSPSTRTRKSRLDIDVDAHVLQRRRHVSPSSKAAKCQKLRANLTPFRGSDERQPVRFVFPPPPLPWSPGNPDSNALELVDYFANVSYSTLSVLGIDARRLRNLLLRMTVSSGTLPTFALRSSLLAVSSLHRDGLRDLAFRYKIAAINALAESAKSGHPPGALESAQHAATCMLLATFETQHHSESSGQWVLYVDSAKHIVQTTGLDQRSDQAELNPLLDWIYYLDVMSWFVMRHWRHPSTLPHSTTDKISLSRGKSPLLLNRHTSIRTVLEPIAAVCDILVEPHDPRAQAIEYQSRLCSLESTLINDSVAKTTTPGSDEGEDIIVAELYQLATLVYLLNGSSSSRIPDHQLDGLIDRGFCLIRKLRTCERCFPLLILGSEARTDEERMLLLELIHKTGAKHNESSLMRVRAGLEMVWSQRDLEADEDEYSELSYLHRLDTVIGSSCTLPFIS